MQTQLIIAENIFEPDSWLKLETDDVCRSLLEHFEQWPDNARIYNGAVSVTHDVTPVTEFDVERLATLSGPFYVILTPKSIPVMIAVAIVAIVAVVAFMPKPKIPVAATRNSQNPSPNNELSARSNKARIGSRIPDIYGTVRAIPDLISSPYSVYVNDQENIHDFMCIGRGHYSVKDVRDASTKLNQIQEACADIYAPFTSPNFGEPQLRVGDYKNKTIYLTRTGVLDPLKQILGTFRSKSVNGQTLYAPNDAEDKENYTDSIRFEAPNKIISVNSAISFGRFFGKEKLVVFTSNFEPAPGSYIFNFTDVYKIESVTNNQITLVMPSSVNESWLRLAVEEASVGNNGAYGTPGHVVGLGSTTSLNNWIGPFVIDSLKTDQLIANFIAPNGIYKDDGTTRTYHTVEIEVGVRPIGVTGVPIGKESFYRIDLKGADDGRTFRGVTLGPQPLGFVGTFAVRARRVTKKDLSFTGQVSDEIKWRDLYGAWLVTQQHFGNVTTVRSVTVATQNATSISDRELNMLVTRKIPKRTSGNQFSTELYPSLNAADIFCAVSFDPFIGNRKPQEIDVPQIYAKLNEVALYFGTASATRFSYTFDTDNLSYEETAFMIADAVFCQAFRRGQVIKWAFEKEHEDHVLLFNHRNKVPRSEQRSITFGKKNDNDGVEYQYISPKDDSIITLYIPTDRSAINPRKIESAGIRDHRQAHFQAWRVYNRMRYQTLLVEFEGLQESNIVMRRDKVLIADNTTSRVNDGEVVSQEGLVLVLSQELPYKPPYPDLKIFLQHVDGSVEMLGITPINSRTVVLSQAPALPLSLDDDASVKTAYMIVDDEDEEIYSCLIEERDPKDNFTSDIKAINYSPKYYANDKDYIKGLLPVPADQIFEAPYVDEGGGSGGYMPLASHFEVTLNNIWASGFTDVRNAYALFNANGRLTTSYYANFYSPPNEWLKGNPVDPEIGALFEIRATRIETYITLFEGESNRFSHDENPEGEPMDVWLPLDQPREWRYVPKSRAIGSNWFYYNAVESKIKFEIRNRDTGEIRATAFIDFTVYQIDPGSGNISGG